MPKKIIIIAYDNTYIHTREMTEKVTNGFPEALQLQGQTFYMFKTINTNVIRLLISWIITNVLMHFVGLHLLVPQPTIIGCATIIQDLLNI